MEGKYRLIKAAKDIFATTSNPKAFRTFQLLLDRITNPETPTHYLGFTDVLHAYIDHLMIVPRNKLQAYDELRDGIWEILEKRGYRNNILTAQEAWLAGGTISQADYEKPYVPLGVLHGTLNVKEAMQARELKVASFAWAVYYLGLGREGEGIPVSLERLREDGSTIRDPRPINMLKFDDMLRNHSRFAEALEASVMEAKKSVKFPFKRD